MIKVVDIMNLMERDEILSIYNENGNLIKIFDGSNLVLDINDLDLLKYKVIKICGQPYAPPGVIIYVDID